MPKPKTSLALVWVEEEQEWDGRPYRADLGEHPTFETAVVARACTWLHDWTEDDRRKAEEHAATKDFGVVLALPCDDHFLARAREIAIARFLETRTPGGRHTIVPK